MAVPILKWAGGKRQLTDEVLRFIPSDYRVRGFHEPMFGAGALTFLLEPSRGSVNDVNPRLMNLYRMVRDAPDDLVLMNKTHRYSKDYFYNARKRFNAPINGVSLNPIEEASLLLYLNRTCYNGLYRENRRGEFNVPFGGYKDPDFVQEDRIRQASKVLAQMQIHDGDFRYVLKVAKAGDVVYFDPPYLPVSETSAFTAYSKHGFAWDDQRRLRDVMERLDAKGVFVILSNSDAPELKKLYADLKSFEMSRIRARRAINCNGSGRGEVHEIIVSNIPRDVMRMRF